MTEASRQVKIVLAGGVGSTRRTLEGLARHGANIVGILGLARSKAAATSGFSCLEDRARELGVPFDEFTDINDPSVYRRLKLWAPDYFFVVGLSQLVRDEVMRIPRIGCVGFHPTCLPRGRGRAPLAWLTLEGSNGAASFFIITEGADAGPVFVQEPFDVTQNDYASDVEKKMYAAIDRSLDRWLPEFLAGRSKPSPQSETDATYYGRRAPSDGLIDWSTSAKTIHTLIRASGSPHPGAFTYHGTSKVIIWRAEVDESLRIRGVVGRIVDGDVSRGWLVQTGDGLLRLTDIEIVPDAGESGISVLRIGAMLSDGSDARVRFLIARVKELEDRLKALENRF